MPEDDPEPIEAIEVPPHALSREALIGLVEEFIMREGTDYGLKEHTFDEKRASVLRLISAGEVAIYFDAETESTTLRRRE